MSCDIFINGVDKLICDATVEVDVFVQNYEFASEKFGRSQGTVWVYC
jgi:hypothetical protein